jgi:hypothetical protein
MDANTLLADEARRIQASGVLGEAKMRRLFDYLAARSLAGESPKELTIAIEVFDKTAAFDVGHDALVRVYVHKLRKTLEKFYADRTGGNLPSLHIPRGEYRLSLNRTAASPDLEPPLPPSSSPGAPVSPASTPTKVPRTWFRGAALLGLGALLGVSLAITASRLWSPNSELSEVRANPFWSSILADTRPILIVVGDYYLIGETDESMEVKRLVREYSVNSKSDFELFINEHPENAERYMDVGLRYLPTSVAFALRDIMPVLGTGQRRINLALESDLTPPALKSMDIIYIGYLSGLGILQQTIFAGSRLSIGQSYDELVDTRTKRTYISQTASQLIEGPQSSGRDPPIAITECFRG